MSQGQNQKVVMVNAIGLIPVLVNLFERLFGGGSGTEKKAAVTRVIGSVLRVGAGEAAANNPEYAQAISQTIDATAAALFPHPDTAPATDPASTPAP